MNQSLKVNGHHIYTFECLLPFLYRVRIGVGKWHYGLNGRWAQELCNEAEDRVLAIVRDI